ncbi:MAG: YtxH domain-containing protein [Lachnospiraceae bacterium]|nr:YtxH domain-containing protein [Lachnospiraceae bacterium]
MAKKFGKFLAFTALTGAACAAVYYVLGNRKDDFYDDVDGGSSDFFEKKADREYVSLNTEEIKEKAGELKEKAEDTKEVIMNKLNEAAEELKEKAKEAAEGVGLVKDNDKETEDFEFEDFTTEEDGEDA